MKRAIHVSVRVVAFDGAVEPDEPRDPEQGGKRTLDVAAFAARVAAFVYQGSLGSNQSSQAVYLERSALGNQVGSHARETGERGDVGCDRVIATPGRVLAAPGVELPVDCKRAPCWVLDEGRADVAHPRVVGCHVVGRSAPGCVLARTLPARGPVSRTPPELPQGSPARCPHCGATRPRSPRDAPTPRASAASSGENVRAALRMSRRADRVGTANRDASARSDRGRSRR